MLLGRDKEMSAIRSGLAAAQGGKAFVLGLRGEAGIGKTVLLAWARDQAADISAVSACGAETESHLPYAALLQLVEPLLALRDRLPDAQKAALEGALALAPSAPGDRHRLRRGAWPAPARVARRLAARHC